MPQVSPQKHEFVSCHPKFCSDGSVSGGNSLLLFWSCVISAEHFWKLNHCLRDDLQEEPRQLLELLHPLCCHQRFTCCSGCNSVRTVKGRKILIWSCFRLKFLLKPFQGIWTSKNVWTLSRKYHHHHKHLWSSKLIIARRIFWSLLGNLLPIFLSKQNQQKHHNNADCSALDS